MEAPRADDKAVRKAVWWITLRCNLKCPYCTAEQVRDPLLDYPIEPTAKWIDAWNRIDGDVLIDISGGEPFLQPDFVDLIVNLDSSKKVAITTNLTYDMTRFAQSVSPEKCVCVTASLHLTSGMNIEYFTGKLLLLKHRGFDVGVNFVAFPEQLWIIDRLRDWFSEFGLRFHVDPYMPGPVYPYNPSGMEKRFLECRTGSDRDDYHSEAVKDYLCDAGTNYFVVSPNGQVSPCVGRLYSTDNAMGNIFDADFKLLGRPLVCRRKFCSGCDADKTRRIVIGEDGHANEGASPDNKGDRWAGIETKPAS